MPPHVFLSYCRLGRAVTRFPDPHVSFPFLLHLDYARRPPCFLSMWNSRRQRSRISRRQFRKHSVGTTEKCISYHAANWYRRFCKLRDEWKSSFSSKNVGRNCPEGAPSTIVSFNPHHSRRWCKHSLPPLAIAKCTSTGKIGAARKMQRATRTGMSGDNYSCSRYLPLPHTLRRFEPSNNCYCLV